MRQSTQKLIRENAGDVDDNTATTVSAINITSSVAQVLLLWSVGVANGLILCSKQAGQRPQLLRHSVRPRRGLIFICVPRAALAGSLARLRACVIRVLRDGRSIFLS